MRHPVDIPFRANHGIFTGESSCRFYHGNSPGQSPRAPVRVFTSHHGKMTVGESSRLLSMPRLRTANEKIEQGTPNSTGSSSPVPLVFLK